MRQQLERISGGQSQQHGQQQAHQHQAPTAGPKPQPQQAQQGPVAHGDNRLFHKSLLEGDLDFVSMGIGTVYLYIRLYRN